MPRMPKRPTTRKNVFTMPPLEAVARPQASAAPGDAEIAARAFELYCERGGAHGHDVEDWLTAERELHAASRSTAA